MLFPSRTFAFPLLAVAFLASNLAYGQSPDPTVASPVMKKQLEAVRGIEALDALTAQIKSLTQQNERLFAELKTAKDEIRNLKTSLKESQANKRQIDSLRAALPQLKLVAFVQGEHGSWADIAVGKNRHRIVSGHDVILPLPDGNSVQAKASIQNDGTVRLDFPELKTSRLLVFQPRVSE